MWTHIIDYLKCPQCGNQLRLDIVFTEHIDVSEEHKKALMNNYNLNLGAWVDEGLLLCEPCASLYPIVKGLPLLLTYRTPVSKEVLPRWYSLHKEKRYLLNTFSLPDKSPPPGELFVAKSFSIEWDEYEYGDTLWTASTQDRIETFHGECGIKKGELRNKVFLEVGCGLGIMTNEASLYYEALSFGMDLSNAAFHGARKYSSNPLVHFVQASIFNPPFSDKNFDYLYSHGVLHHTFDTLDAIRRAAELISVHGNLYVWLYGFDDINRTIVRKFAFFIEKRLRPLIAKLPNRFATILLLPLIPIYQVLSMQGIKVGTHTRIYSSKQALHAIRDRFSPLYAHRHTNEEIAELLSELGFQRIERVHGESVTLSWAHAIDYNVALRGVDLITNR